MSERRAELPVRAALKPDGLYVALSEIDPSELHDPFMQETVKRLAAREAVRAIPLAELGREPKIGAPAGVIFHVARCGSTLVSQLLKFHADLRVYAEPLPFNELLVPPQKASRSEVVGALRTLGQLFARHANGPYVVKLSSWNTLFCDVVAEAFPTTPWVLCVRDPVEVCVSLLQSTPGWLRDHTAPGHPFTPLIDPSRQSRSREEFVARLYGAFCTTARKIDGRLGRIVPYETLPAAVWEVVTPHLGLSLDESLKKRMSDAAALYSKAPSGRAVQFVSDSEAKRSAASPELRRAVDTFARPALDQLARALEANDPPTHI